MWARAWPENVISTILYACKIGGEKKEKKNKNRISESWALQSKQNMAPPLCNALCIIKLVLQPQQRLKAESSAESECACPGRQMMPNGKPSLLHRDEEPCARRAPPVAVGRARRSGVQRRTLSLKGRRSEGDGGFFTLAGERSWRGDYRLGSPPSGGKSGTSPHNHVPLNNTRSFLELQ